MHEHPLLFGELQLPAVAAATLAIALLVSTVICFFLTRHLVGPIDRDVFGRLLHANPAVVRSTVEHGVVLLTGRVEYRSDIDVAVRRIATVPGVVAVKNRLDYWWNGTIDRPEPVTDAS